MTASDRSLRASNEALLVQWDAIHVYSEVPHQPAEAHRNCPWSWGNCPARSFFFVVHQFCSNCDQQCVSLHTLPQPLSMQQIWHLACNARSPRQRKYLIFSAVPCVFFHLFCCKNNCVHVQVFSEACMFGIRCRTFADTDAHPCLHGFVLWSLILILMDEKGTTMSGRSYLQTLHARATLIIAI